MPIGGSASSVRQRPMRKIPRCGRIVDGMPARRLEGSQEEEPAQEERGDGREPQAVEKKDGREPQAVEKKGSEHVLSLSSAGK